MRLVSKIIDIDFLTFVRSAPNFIFPPFERNYYMRLIFLKGAISEKNSLRVVDRCYLSMSLKENFALTIAPFQKKRFCPFKKDFISEWRALVSEVKK